MEYAHEMQSSREENKVDNYRSKRKKDRNTRKIRKEENKFLCATVLSTAYSVLRY